MNRYEVKLTRRESIDREVKVIVEAESAEDVDDVLFDSGSFDAVDAMFNGQYEGTMGYTVDEHAGERGLTITEQVTQID